MAKTHDELLFSHYLHCTAYRYWRPGFPKAIYSTGNTSRKNLLYIDKAESCHFNSIIATRFCFLCHNYYILISAQSHFRPENDMLDLAQCWLHAVKDLVHIVWNRNFQSLAPYAVFLLLFFFSLGFIFIARPVESERPINTVFVRLSVCDQERLKLVCSATEASWSLEISYIATIRMML